MFNVELIENIQTDISTFILRKKSKRKTDVERVDSYL